MVSFIKSKKTCYKFFFLPVVRSERQEVHIKREMARDLYEKKQEHFAKLQSDYDEEELLKKKNIAYQRICFSIDEVGDLCDLIENSKNSDLIQVCSSFKHCFKFFLYFLNVFSGTSHQWPKNKRKTRKWPTP